ncbi:hypothetical protein K466DRAFT_582909 [Polyporus arcularius HHB13444]|uniref:Uncharacterized protein n=1 Tax=Polyporus arcularius HHB13444 TaxID=1314778 RepID=A0A5C3PRX6_9APHY|nr:hypothetical protein K466DRAFT_582909 [Polyporus arcularius HHB13444]
MRRTRLCRLGLAPVRQLVYAPPPCSTRTRGHGWRRNIKHDGSSEVASGSPRPSSAKHNFTFDDLLISSGSVRNKVVRVARLRG